MRLSTQGKDILKRLEGFSDVAYIPVKGDVPTIGYGFTEGVKLGDTMTQAEADKRLLTILVPYENAVLDACSNPPNQNEFDAMVLLCFNIGIGGFKKSTVLKAHNAGDHQAASRAFGLWNKSSGKVYKGLTRRRAEEAAIYLTPAREVAVPMPQSVDAESTMAQSSINRAGTIAGGTAAMAAVTEVSRTLSDVKVSLASLGDWALPIALLCIAGTCVYIVWQRVAQRREGWA